MFIAPVVAFLALFGPMIVKPDITDGSTITKLQTIKVLVQSDSIVTQVEFYVNGDLRDTATSTPYTFQLDPLAEPDGTEKLTFTGYNSDGQKASVSLSITIDSGASKGPAANTDQARDMLSQSKFDDAIFDARLALKSNPNYVPAEIVLSRAFLAKSVYDKAQEFAEDAVRNDPKNVDALSALSAIQLKRAFDSFATSGDRNEVVNSMGDAIAKAIDARHKVLDFYYDKVPAPTPTNLVAYADGAIQTQHYSVVVSALTNTFNTQGLKTELGNRIAYAQLRLGRMDALERTLNQMKAAKTLDPYGNALWAVLDEYKGDEAGADDSIKAGIEGAGANLGVQTAQVYIALHRNKIEHMSSLEATLESDQGQLPIVSYYLSVVDYRLKKYDDAEQAFHETVLMEPVMYPMYIERGNEALAKVTSSKQTTGPDRDYNLQVAQRMYTAAQEAKPDSAEALTALAILDLTQSKINDAAQMAQAAVSAAPSYAAAHYEAAAVYAMQEQQLEDQAAKIRKDNSGNLDADANAKVDAANRSANAMGEKAKGEFNEALKLDPKRLAGTELPRNLDVFQYFYYYGALPLITAP